MNSAVSVFWAEVASPGVMITVLFGSTRACSARFTPSFSATLPLGSFTTSLILPVISLRQKENDSWAMPSAILTTGIFALVLRSKMLVTVEVFSLSIITLETVVV